MARKEKIFAILPNIVERGQENRSHNDQSDDGLDDVSLLREPDTQISAEDWLTLIANDLTKLKKALQTKDAIFDPVVQIKKMQCKLSTLQRVLLRTAPGPTQLSLFIEK